MTVLGCGWEPEEEDWPGGLGSEVAGDGESTPVCFWLRGTEADWEIHESEGGHRSHINSCCKTLQLFIHLVTALSRSGTINFYSLSNSLFKTEN